MPECRFSKRADQDLQDIYLYSLVSFGLRQADEYAASLRATCRALSETPGIGRGAAELLPGLRQHEHAAHVIFYTVIAGGIQIVRILGESMEWRSHLADEEI